jgi:hypothetical protein
MYSNKSPTIGASRSRSVLSRLIMSKTFFQLRVALDSPGSPRRALLYCCSVGWSPDRCLTTGICVRYF